MTGADYINYAKQAFYPVETYLEDGTLALFVNTARRKVIKYAKIGFKEYSYTLNAQTPNFTVSPYFLEVYSVILQWDNTIRYELTKIPWGRFPLSTQTFFAPPWNYAFIPPNQIEFYPCPDRSYTYFLYGVPYPAKNYIASNLGEADTDITTENYLEPVAVLIASQIARFDQNYELSKHFEDLFVNVMRVSKT